MVVSSWFLVKVGVVSRRLIGSLLMKFVGIETVGRLVRPIVIAPILVVHTVSGLAAPLLSSNVIAGVAGLVSRLILVKVCVKLPVTSWCMCRVRWQQVLQQLDESMKALSRTCSCILVLKFLVWAWAQRLVRLLGVLVWRLQWMLLQCVRPDEVLVGVTMQQVGTVRESAGSVMLISDVLVVLSCCSVIRVRLVIIGLMFLLNYLWIMLTWCLVMFLLSVVMQLLIGWGSEAGLCGLRLVTTVSVRV